MVSGKELVEATDGYDWKCSLTPDTISIDLDSTISSNNVGVWWCVK